MLYLTKIRNAESEFTENEQKIADFLRANVSELVAKQPGMVGVRLGVKQTGCAGFGYVLDSVSEPDKDDLLFEHDGAKLFVPLQAMPFIDGTEVDFVREGLNQIFKFHNPKAQNECGCGESFGV